MRVITLAAVCAAAGLATAGCKSNDSANLASPPAASGGVAQTAPATRAEPHTEAAVRAAANEEFDAYASADYGAAWDQWYAPAKKLISRANYMRLFELCPAPAAGVRFQIEKITMDSDREAHVRVVRLIAVFTYRFVYEAGHWRFVPEADSMRDYRTKSIEQMVAEHRAQGACGK